jgi:hypothetical protein
MSESRIRKVQAPRRRIYPISFCAPLTKWVRNPALGVRIVALAHTPVPRIGCWQNSRQAQCQERENYFVGFFCALS